MLSTVAKSSAESLTQRNVRVICINKIKELSSERDRLAMQQEDAASRVVSLRFSHSVAASKLEIVNRLLEQVLDNILRDEARRVECFYDVQLQRRNISGLRGVS